MLDDRHPGVGHVPGQFKLHAGLINRDVARHDEQIFFLPLPEGMNDRCHQPQHASGPLEPVQRGPVVVEPIEEFRMDRVGHLDSVFVGSVFAGLWKLLMLLGVHVGECTGHRIACYSLLISQRFE